MTDPRAYLGLPHARIDGAAKVCGSAPFAGDVRLEALAYAALVTSGSARGRIEHLITEEALRTVGVRDVLTYREVGEAVRSVPHLMKGGWTNSTARPLASPEIHYAGQIVALVVGDTREAAEEGASRIRVAYTREAVEAELPHDPVAGQNLSELDPEHKTRQVGDVEAALASAHAVVAQTYETPVQHHNALELFSTTCAWDGDQLTIHEPTRYVGAVKHGVAAQLGIDPERVRVVCRFIGGHFGSKFGLSQYTALVALAARRLGRPVTLTVSRRDNFTIATHRTETRHRVRLGADAQGRLVALSHEALCATSRFDAFAMEGTDVTTALYACPAVSAVERVGRVDRNTPGPMRAPPELPYLFALESAMDELARTLGLDPIELRRRNDTLRDPVTGKAFTTRPLMRCFEAGAQAFGWRAPAEPPGARREGEWLVGQGCAAAARPVKTGAARIRVVLSPDGQVRVQTAQHEIGNGLYTLLAMTAAERLQVSIDAVTVELGDTRLPEAGLSGGSSTTTSLVNALAEGCRRIRADSAFAVGGGLARTRDLVAEVDFVPPGLGDDAIDKLRGGHFQLAPGAPDKLAWSFGAQFAEVRVHASTGEVRVPRLVGAFAAGRILNPMTADSQLKGGMVWGLGSALLEATEIDARTGRYVNANLAEYLIATQADVGELVALQVDDPDDEVNPEGVKGLGEIGIIGVNAAIANAVFDATGRRIRALPIRPENLM